METITGFYTFNPFWADKQPKIETKGWSKTYTKIGPNLNTCMAEIVWEYENPQYKIQVCRDGFIGIKRKGIRKQTDLLQKFEEYLLFANVLHFLIETIFFTENNNFHYFEAKEISHEDLLSFTKTEWGGFGGPIRSFAYEHASCRDINTYNEHQDFKDDFRIAHRQILKKENFNKVIKLLDLLIEKDQLQTTNSMAKAQSEFQNGNYRAVYSLVWPEIETLLTQKYLEVIKNLNLKTEMQNLLKKVSLYKKNNILVQEKVLKRASAERVKKCEDRRDKLFHNTRNKATIEDASIVLHLFKDILFEIEDINIEVITIIHRKGF